jgi:Kef-type K+ transport system membrane component KefB
MINTYIVYAGIFLISFLLGKIFEKFRIPWVFSGIFVGLLLTFFSLSHLFLEDPIFVFLATMGMYFLLFIIGFQIDLKLCFQQTKTIFRTTFFVFFLEVLFGSILLYFVFGVSLPISILVASSFATVGEAVLLPILDEFHLTKSKLGQRILNIGVLDDVFEIFIIVIVSIVVGSTTSSSFNISFNLLILFALFLLVYLLFEFHKNIQNFKYKDVNSLFLFVLFFVFLFIGIGEYIDSASLGALFAGISLKNLVPQHKLNFIEKEVSLLSYGFLAPLFFVWVGSRIELSVLQENFFSIILVVLVTGFAKVLASLLSSKKELGVRQSIILGVGLSVKLSTGIVVLSVLLENGIISSSLFSILLGATIVFTMFVPILLPILINVWLGKEKRIRFSKSFK